MLPEVVRLKIEPIRQDPDDQADLVPWSAYLELWSSRDGHAERADALARKLAIRSEFARLGWLVAAIGWAFAAILVIFAIGGK